MLTDPIWITVLAALVVGAPMVFFHFVGQKKLDDNNEIASYIYQQVEKERKDDVKASDADYAKMKEEIRRLKAMIAEKDSALKEKEAEIEKVKPFLKYLRPPSSSEPS